MVCVHYTYLITGIVYMYVYASDVMKELQEREYQMSTLFWIGIIIIWSEEL